MRRFNRWTGIRLRPPANRKEETPTMKKRITPQRLRALELNPRERRLLTAFAAGNRDWIARPAVPLEAMLRRTLAQPGRQLLRLRQVEAHPVYERWQPNPKSSGTFARRSLRRAGR